jgi:hypothetical protein
MIKHTKPSNRLGQNIHTAARIHGRKEWTRPDQKVKAACKDAISTVARASW